MINIPIVRKHCEITTFQIKSKQMETDKFRKNL